MTINNNPQPQSYYPVDVPDESTRFVFVGNYGKLAELIDQDISIELVDRAFITKGKLLYCNDHMIVVRTMIGLNKHNREIVDDKIFMMRNIASVSRNPTNMEIEDHRENTDETIKDRYNK